MKYHVVCIWISEHQNPDNNLPTSKNDASSFFDMLTNGLGENLWMQKLLLDHEATLGNIKVALWKTTADTIDKDDVFIFYFSWHGAPNTSGEEVFLVPHDWDNKDIENSCISITELTENLHHIKSKQKIIIIDSCYSWTMPHSKSLKIPIKKGFSGKVVKDFTALSWEGSVVFTASSENEAALATPELSNSLFTYYLLEELKNRKEDKVSITTLQTPVTEKVLNYAKDKYRHIQTPCFKGDIKGNIYLPKFKEREVSPTMDFWSHMHRATNIPNPTTIQITYENTDIQNLINTTIDIVIMNQKERGKYKAFSFNSYCMSIVNGMGEKLNELLTNNRHRLVQSEEEILMEVQEIGLNILILACVLSALGEKIQLDIFCSCIKHLYQWPQDNNWISMLFDLDGIIYSEILYAISIMAIGSWDFYFLNKYSEVVLYDKSYDTSDSIILESKVHYRSIFWGYADKSMDYIIKTFSTALSWIKKIDYNITNGDDIKERIIQSNFLFRLYSKNKDKSLRYDFSRYYASRLKPLLREISSNKDYEETIKWFIWIKDTDNIYEVIKKSIESTYNNGWSSGYRWESIKPSDLDQYIN